MVLRFHVDIVNVEAVIFSGSAESLVVPGKMGALGILARHARYSVDSSPEWFVSLFRKTNKKFSLFQAAFWKCSPMLSPC